MDFTNRITSTACFDREAYADIAKDEKGTLSALGVVALAGAACGVGIGKARWSVCLDLTVFALVVFSAATATALLAAHRYDPSAWRWRRALRAVRILGYSTSPGIAGIAGFLFGAKFVVLAGIWCVASYLYALRLAFDFKPEGSNGPIALVVTIASGIVAWGYSSSIRGGLGFLLLLLFLAVCIFHKPFLRWIFGHADRAANDKKARTRALFRRKGWDVTLRELVETFTLIRTRRKAGKASVEPPPLPVDLSDIEHGSGELEPSHDSRPGTGKPMDDAPGTKGEMKPEGGERGEHERTADMESDGDAVEETDGVSRDEALLEVNDDEKSEEPELEAPQPAPAPASGAPGISQDALPELGAVCERIFDENISGYESNATFREEFKGRVVRWSGKVKQVEAFSYDTVFGGEAGAKVLMEVAELATSYGKLPIEAVLRIPSEEFQGAEELVGETIRFTGKLLESDPYARRLFLVGELK